MKLWQSLFAIIWIVFLEFLLVMTPGVPSWVVWVHVALGLVIIGIAMNNFNGVRQTTIAGRVKRIAKSTFQLSILMAVLGVLLILDVGQDWVIPVVGVSVFGLILFFHVVNAFAIITQSAATAIAYDMWEDKELDQVTKPGEVPPPPPMSTLRSSPDPKP